MFNLIKLSFKPKHLKKASLLVVLMLFLTFSGCSFNNQSSLTASSQVSSTSSLAVSTNLNSQDQVNLVAIEVNKLPTQLDYSPNEVVTTSGGELRVVYSDYSVRYISMRDSMIETNRLNISTLGNSSVTLKHQEGSIAKYVTYNVNIVPFVVNVNSVALDIVSSDVLRTQSVQLNPIITPLNGLVRDIKWSSSNPLIARVDNNGLVTPLNAGEVIITVTVNNLYSAASRLNIINKIVDTDNEDQSNFFGVLNVQVDYLSQISVSGATNSSNLRYVLTNDSISKSNIISSWNRSTTLTEAESNLTLTFLSSVTLSLSDYGKYLIVAEIDNNNNLKAAGQTLIDQDLITLSKNDFSILTTSTINRNTEILGGVFELDGNDSGYVNQLFINPQVFTIEAWIKSTDSNSGKIIGFEDSTANQLSGKYDRHIYIDSNGKLVFGIFDNLNQNSLRTATSTSSVNNSYWHHVVATYGGTGTDMKLYIDGHLEDSETLNGAEVYNGYWRFGSYSLLSWPNASNGYFTGTIGLAKIYLGKELNTNEVLNNFNNDKLNFIPELSLYIDPNNPDSYSNSSSTVTNLANSNLNGTLTSITKDGPAFNFTDSKITFSDNEELEPGTEDFTIETWLNVPHENRWRAVFGKVDTGGATQNISYLIRINNLNQIFLVVNNGVVTNGTSTAIESSTYLISSNTWFQVVYVWKRGKSLETFVNGQLIGTKTHSHMTVLNTTNPLYFGNYNNKEFPGNMQIFSGKLGITKLYFGALTPAMVKSNYDEHKILYGLN
jgi:hypothetical protein